MSTVTCRVVGNHPIMLAGKRALVGEIHTVNLGQYLQAKEQYPDALIAINPTPPEVVASEDAPPIEPAKEAEPPHDESVQVSPTTRKRRTAN